MPNLTKQQIIERLSAHQPIEEMAARRGITVRWVATAALMLLLPLGVFFLRNQHPFLSDHVWEVAVSLTLLGFLGVYIAYETVSRKEASERQWGFSALTKDECEELGEVSLDVPEISIIVDHWLEVWVSSGKHPRGRDLALVKEMVAAWKAADGEKVSSTSNSDGERGASRHQPRVHSR